MKRTTRIYAALTLLASLVPAWAQQMEKHPAAACSATATQLEANKKVVRDFYATTGAARVALIDESYKQHDPVFVKRAAETKQSDYTEFTSGILRAAAAGRPAVAPQERTLEVLMAECDLVTAVNKRSQQDPTAAAGSLYDYYTFDTFRVKNGKLTEHWDGMTISAPASAPAR